MKYPLNADDYNMSCQEVADRLGWTLSTVETLQQRAIMKLRKLCKERGIKFTDLVENLSK
jgi:DNA-directed RNA polymerase specialized sigma24 family protein